MSLKRLLDCVSVNSILNEGSGAWPRCGVEPVPGYNQSIRAIPQQDFPE